MYFSGRPSDPPGPDPASPPDPDPPPGGDPGAPAELGRGAGSDPRQPVPRVAVDVLELDHVLEHVPGRRDVAAALRALPAVGAVALERQLLELVVVGQRARPQVDRLAALGAGQLGGAEAGDEDDRR